MSALLSGLAGASALTALHEAARHTLPDAPRVDLLGERALALALEAAGQPVPGRNGLYAAAMGGDLVSNTLYYAMVGLGSRKSAILRGTMLGLSAGIGALTLPPLLGLSTEPVTRTPVTALMTVAWYTIGGAIAGTVYERTG